MGGFTERCQPLLLWLAIFIFVVPAACQSATEVQALVSLRDSIVNWSMFAAENNIVGWNDSVPACEWTGVSCSDNLERVLSLRLRCHEDCKVKAVGTLPAALSYLAALDTLDLSANAFYGSLPPEWSGRFPVLKELALHRNYISGAVPWRNTSFPALQVLRLDYNQLEGAFPDDLRLPRLQILRISDNRLDGALGLNLLQNLPSLRVLAMKNNSLSGALPRQWSSGNLEGLYLESNTLTGGVPATWGLPNAFPSLKRLDLSKNPLGGALPAEWTGPHSPMPNLQSLNLSTAFLTGELPASWAAPGAFPGIESIDISGDSIGGSIDVWAGFSALKRLIIRPGNSGLCVWGLPSALPFRLCSAEDPSCLKEMPDLANCSSLRAGAADEGSSDGDDFPIAAVVVPVALVGTVAIVVAAGIFFSKKRGRRKKQRSAALSQETHPFDTFEGQAAYTSPFALAAAPFAATAAVVQGPISRRLDEASDSDDEALPCTRLKNWLTHLVKRTFTSSRNPSQSLASSISSPLAPHPPPAPITGEDVEMSLTVTPLASPLQQSMPPSGRSSAAETPKSAASRRSQRSSTFAPEIIAEMPLSDWEVDPSELEIERRLDGSEWFLGSGSTGRVYRALYHSVQPVAVKRLRLGEGTDQVTLENFKREIAVLRACRDANIVLFVGAHVGPDSAILVTEFMEGGNLADNIASGRVSWWRRGRKLAIDIAKGLTYLHARNIAHFDLKSANILLAKGRRIAKICDVGMARVLGEGCQQTSGIATLAWSAPEILWGESTPHTVKADIYSLGVILWEICAMEVPRRGQLRDLRVPQECPEEVRDLILECLDTRPGSRPTAVQVAARLMATPEGVPSWMSTTTVTVSDSPTSGTLSPASGIPTSMSISSSAIETSTAEGSPLGSIKSLHGAVDKLMTQKKDAPAKP